MKGIVTFPQIVLQMMIYIRGFASSYKKLLFLPLI